MKGIPMKTDANKKAAWLIASAMAVCSVPAMADAGAYLGVGIGDAGFEVDGIDGGEGSSVDLDGSDTGVKIFGGYMFNDYIGVEVGYYDFGNADDNFSFDGFTPGGGTTVLDGEIEAEVTAFSLQAIGSVPVGPISVFGKVGIISYDADVSVRVDGFGSASAGDEGEELAYGVGAAWNIGNFAIRGEYEIFDIDDVDVDMISIGAVIKF